MYFFSSVYQKIQFLKKNIVDPKLLNGNVAYIFHTLIFYIINSCEILSAFSECDKYSKLVSFILTCIKSNNEGPVVQREDDRILVIGSNLENVLFRRERRNMKSD